VSLCRVALIRRRLASDDADGVNTTPSELSNKDGNRTPTYDSSFLLSFDSILPSRLAVRRPEALQRVPFWQESLQSYAQNEIANTAGPLSICTFRKFLNLANQDRYSVNPQRG